MEQTKLKRLISQDTQLGAHLSSGLPYLLEVLRSDQARYEDIAGAISNFPNIAARLIFLANSAWTSPSVPIIHLEMACARLGLSMVRNISVALCIASTFSLSGCKKFDRERFWNSALLVADGSAWLASCLPEFSEQELKTIHSAGLLHNLGLLWLADNWPKETSTALEISAADDSMSTHDALREIVDTDYCKVGEILGKAWALPDVLTTVMKEHRNFTYNGTDFKYVAIVRHVVQMVSALHRGVDQRPVLPDEPDLCSSRLSDVYAKLQKKMSENRELTQLIFSSS